MHLRLRYSLLCLILLIIPAVGSSNPYFSSVLALDTIEVIPEGEEVSYARNVVTELQPVVAAWQANFEVVALELFGILVMLDFIWTLIQATISGYNVPKMVELLVERSFFYGVSFLVITEGPELCQQIMEGFHGLALSESPNKFDESALIVGVTILAAVSVVIAVLGTALSCFWLVFFPLTFEPMWAQILILSNLILIGIFISAITQSVILYIEVMLLLAFSPIIFALGGLKMTSAASMGFIRQCIGAGIQLVVLVCLLESMADILTTLLLDLLTLNFIGLVKCMFALYLLSMCIKVVPSSIAKIATGGAGEFTNNVDPNASDKGANAKLKVIGKAAKENKNREKASKAGVTPSQYRREKMKAQNADSTNRLKKAKSAAEGAAILLNSARSGRDPNFRESY